MATYPGGKNASGTYQRIINQMPPHREYIEAFLGSGAIMRYKKPAEYSIGLDIDQAAVEAARRWSDAIPAKVWSIDAITWLRSWGIMYRVTGLKASTLVYLDPPYVMASRSSKRAIYKHEMSDEDHERLLEVILDLPCMVMISGYNTRLYAQMLASWRTVVFDVTTRAGTRATEYLWMNFPEPVRLHDYQYLGEDYRQRLQGMNSLERYALMATIAELDDAAGGIAGDGEATR